MTYAEAIAALETRGAELAVRRKFDLEHMRVLAAELGDPQRRFRSVLIAGTNGKGSTAATLASICASAEIRTGLYTSPHLSRVNERVQWSGVDGGLREISDGDFAACFSRVERAAQALVAAGRLPNLPSFFESVTAVAFCALADAGVELAILEVGLGGRLDATNIVDPVLSVIADIDFDHMEWLGSTLPQITREKCGILRDGGLLVTLPQHPVVNQALGEEAMRRGVHAVSAAEYVPSRDVVPGLRNVYSIDVAGEPLRVDSPLGGQHQQRNLALAIGAALQLRTLGYKISVAAMEHGIARTRWPGRLEFLPAEPGRPAILLDVAHNPAGVWTLRAALSRMDHEGAVGFAAKTLIFGCLTDKPLAEMAQILFPLFTGEHDQVILAQPDSPRAADADSLMNFASRSGVRRATVRRASDEALRQALETTPANGLIVVAGSVYLVGALRPLLLTR